MSVTSATRPLFRTLRMGAAGMNRRKTSSERRPAHKLLRILADDTSSPGCVMVVCLGDLPRCRRSMMVGRHSVVSPNQAPASPSSRPR